MAGADGIVVKDPMFRPELRVVPDEVLHSLDTTCACEAHIGVGWSVPKSVPKRGPKPVIRQPTPTTKPIKNGPKIVNFRPVL